jgi:serine/threonine protein phosphatase 1
VPRRGHDGLFAIGDVHGCHAELVSLLARLPLHERSTVVFLGDYVDRGPDSRAVIDTILELGRRCEVVALLGNHEDMMLEFIDRPQSPPAAMFIYNGGSATLASYADDMGRVSLPAHHLSFLRGLKLYYQTNDFFFVHAGVPDIPLWRIGERHRPRLLWVRENFLNSTYAWKKIIVHGHTPAAEVEVTGRRINLDTGCYMGGHLTAMNFQNGDIYSVPRAPDPRVPVLRDESPRRAAKRFKGRVDVFIHDGPHVFRFVTVDYSEFGMFIHAFDGHAPVFERGDMIRGRIGSDDADGVQFHGQVLRTESRGSHTMYGVRVLETVLPDGATRPQPPRPPH